MPIPKPKPDEEKNEFISRCISDLKNADYDKSDKQIQAICYTTFDRNKKKKAMKGNFSFKNFLEKEIFYTEKGLSREEARKKTIGKVKQDHRGFTYDPDTGKCVYI